MVAQVDKVKHAQLQRRIRFDRIMIVLAVISFAVAANLGSRRESGRLEQYIVSLVPGDCQYKLLNANTFLCYQEDESDPLAYIINQETDGYAGPMEVALLVDTNGVVLDLVVVSQKESPSYFKKVVKLRFPETLKGKSYSDPFMAGEDYDAISGATFTSVGIANAVKEGSRRIASLQPGIEVPEAATPKILFGIPEITLVLLYLMVLIGLQSKKRVKKAIRWLTLSIGLIVLGFWFSVPLSLGKVNMFLLGYWPQWQSNLYWYMLVISVFGLILLNKKNLYCTWFCPFLAAQEYLALVGGGKVKIPKKVRYWFTIFQRILAWLAIVLAFYYRMPSKLNYEVFGTFFNLTGSIFLFVLLAIYLLASLFIKRPYCHTLCPVNALNDLSLDIRKWITRN